MTPKLNKQRLLPSRLYSFQGSLIAPRFFTMPSISMNFPRLEIHTTKKIKARIAKSARQAIVIKVLKLFSIHPYMPGNVLPVVGKLLNPDPPPSEHCERNAQNPNVNHFLNSKGLNRMRTMWFHAGVIGSITEIFLCFSMCSYLNTSRNGAGVI